MALNGDIAPALAVFRKYQSKELCFFIAHGILGKNYSQRI